MFCPFCNEACVSVKDSRSLSRASLRRKRFCGSCRRSFFTLERLHCPKLCIVDDLGKKSAFDREKLLFSIRKIGKGMPEEDFHALLDSVERDFYSLKPKSVTKSELVEHVALLLTKFSPVLGGRFLATYSSFDSLQELIDSISKLER